MDGPGGIEKKRVIVDYKNITSDILELFTDRYPYGYDDEDIIKFQNSAGETVRAVPFETADTRFLVKVSVEMDRKIEAFMDDEDLEEDNSTNSTLIDELPAESTDDD